MLEGIAASPGRSAVATVPRVQASRGRFDVLAVAGLSAGALALGLYRSNITSLWTDELFSVTLASKPFPVLLRQLWSENANMSLYYLVLGAWLNLLNHLGISHPSEWMIRLPSIVFAAAALVAAYFVAKRLFGNAVALFGTALLMVNYVFLMEVAQARAYSLELFLQLIGWYLFIRILENPTRKAVQLGVAFGAVMTLAMYADLFTAFVILAQLAAFLAVTISGSLSRRRTREALRPALVAALTLIVGVAPLALDVMTHGAPTGWIPTPGLKDLFTFAGAVSGANPAFALVVVVGGALGLSMAMRHSVAAASEQIGTRAIVILLATWIAVPLVVSWGLSRPPFGMHVFLTRYLVVIIPPICILCAAGVYSLSRSHLKVARVMVIVSILLAATAVPQYYFRVQREDFRTASAWLVHQYQAGDGVACASLGCAFAMEYYAQGKMQTDAPGNYVWSAGEFGHVSVDPATLAAYARAHSRIFYVYGTAGQSPYIDPDKQWLQDNGYRNVDRTVTVPGSAGAVTVELWSRVGTGENLFPVGADDIVLPGG